MSRKPTQAPTDPRKLKPGDVGLDYAAGVAAAVQDAGRIWPHLTALDTGAMIHAGYSVGQIRAAMLCAAADAEDETAISCHVMPDAGTTGASFWAQATACANQGKG